MTANEKTAAPNPVEPVGGEWQGMTFNDYPLLVHPATASLVQAVLLDAALRIVTDKDDRQQPAPVEARDGRKPSNEAIAQAFWEARRRENEMPISLRSLEDAAISKFGDEIVRRAKELQPALAQPVAAPAPQEAIESIASRVSEAARLIRVDAKYASYFGETWLDGMATELRAAAEPPAPVSDETFQSRVAPWMQATFGPEISADIIERNHRFLEESLELVQSLGCTASEAHQLVDYVFGRAIGETAQEVGGVMVTLAALCLAAGVTDMHSCGEGELARVWTKIDVIRAKQAAKPKHSPLPAPVTPTDGEACDHLWVTGNFGPTICARCSQVSASATNRCEHGVSTQRDCPRCDQEAEDGMFEDREHG